MSLLFGLLTIATTITIGIIIYFKWSFAYWKKKGFPYLEPKFPFGTSENPFTRKDCVGIRLKKQYQELKKQGHKHGGLYIFTKPSYMPIDPDYIKNIMSKDFQHFVDRGNYYNEKDDPLSANLLNIEGHKWRKLRTKLTPFFTSGKMKMLFQTLIVCSDQLVLAMNELHKKNAPVYIKEVLGCFTTDIIGSYAFGVECNSFKDPDSAFRRYGEKIFASVTTLQAIRHIIAFSNPKLGLYLGVMLTNPEATKFFMNVVKNTVDYREKTNFVRNDLIQLLIDLKNNVKNNDEEENNGSKNAGKGLTIEEIAAQAFVFFVAGFETSSTTMSFCLFELAMNPKIQQKVRDEVKRVLEKHGRKITYDAIMEMKYLSQVIDETLRKHPPSPVIPRMCVEDYQVPGSNVTLEKGTHIMIPVIALHHDPEFYAEPEKFDPERFSDENKQHIPPFTYIPFGEGPRICIGYRLGLMQTKVGLAVLLKNFKFVVNHKTQVPLIMDPFNFILSVKGGIWLDIEKI